jgi:hypothetical protein
MGIKTNVRELSYLLVTSRSALVGSAFLGNALVGTTLLSDAANFLYKAVLSKIQW